MTRITADTLADAVASVAALDADFARIVDEVGLPPLRDRPPGFATLIRSITSQQLSVASAAAILERLEATTNPLTPERFLALSDEKLREIGFSRQKTTYGRDLARAVQDGLVDFAALDELPEKEAVAALTKIRGIGRWTAEVYLLFAHGHPDQWPADDLALMVCVQRVKGLPERPKRKQMDAIAEAWRPWRGAAARLLWHYYRNAPPT